MPPKRKLPSVEESKKELVEPQEVVTIEDDDDEIQIIHAKVNPKKKKKKKKVTKPKAQHVVTPKAAIDEDREDSLFGNGSVGEASQCSQDLKPDKAVIKECADPPMKRSKSPDQPSSIEISTKPLEKKGVQGESTQAVTQVAASMHPPMKPKGANLTPPLQGLCQPKQKQSEQVESAQPITPVAASIEPPLKQEGATPTRFQGLFPPKQKQSGQVESAQSLTPVAASVQPPTKQKQKESTCTPFFRSLFPPPNPILQMRPKVLKEEVKEEIVDPALPTMNIPPPVHRMANDSETREMESKKADEAQNKAIVSNLKQIVKGGVKESEIENEGQTEGTSAKGGEKEPQSKKMSALQEMAKKSFRRMISVSPQMTEGEANRMAAMKEKKEKEKTMGKEKEKEKEKEKGESSHPLSAVSGGKETPSTPINATGDATTADPRITKEIEEKKEGREGRKEKKARLEGGQDIVDKAGDRVKASNATNVVTRSKDKEGKEKTRESMGSKGAVQTNGKPQGSTSKLSEDRTGKSNAYKSVCKDGKLINVIPPNMQEGSGQSPATRRSTPLPLSPLVLPSPSSVVTPSSTLPPSHSIPPISTSRPISNQPPTESPANRRSRGPPPVPPSTTLPRPKTTLPPSTVLPPSHHQSPNASPSLLTPPPSVSPPSNDSSPPVTPSLFTPPPFSASPSTVLPPAFNPRLPPPVFIPLPTVGATVPPPPSVPPPSPIPPPPPPPPPTPTSELEVARPTVPPRFPGKKVKYVVERVVSEDSVRPEALPASSNDSIIVKAVQKTLSQPRLFVFNIDKKHHEISILEEYFVKYHGFQQITVSSSPMDIFRKGMIRFKSNSDAEKVLESGQLHNVNGHSIFLTPREGGDQKSMQLAIVSAEQKKKEEMEEEAREKKRKEEKERRDREKRRREEEERRKERSNRRRSRSRSKERRRRSRSRSRDRRRERSRSRERRRSRSRERRGDGSRRMEGGRDRKKEEERPFLTRKEVTEEAKRKEDAQKKQMEAAKSIGTFDELLGVSSKTVQMLYNMLDKPDSSGRSEGAVNCASPGQQQQQAPPTPVVLQPPPPPPLLDVVIPPYAVPPPPPIMDYTNATPPFGVPLPPPPPSSSASAWTEAYNQYHDNPWWTRFQ